MIRDGLSNTIMLGELQRMWDPGNPYRGGTRGTDSRRSEDGWAVGGSAVGFSTETADDHASKGGGLNAYHFESPGSDHPGGALFSLADGSVHFVFEHIDPKILKAMGSREGNDEGHILAVE